MPDEKNDKPQQPSVMDAREYGPVLLYLVRKTIEAECDCGKQSTNIADHTDKCTLRGHVFRHVVHAQERVQAKALAEANKAKLLEEAAATKARNDQSTKDAAAAVADFFGGAPAVPPPAGGGSK